MENKLLEKLGQIDNILMRLEDYTHGQDGNDISRARNNITDLLEFFQSFPAEEINKQEWISTGNNHCVCQQSYTSIINGSYICHTCNKPLKF